MVLIPRTLHHHPEPLPMQSLHRAHHHGARLIQLSQMPEPELIALDSSARVLNAVHKMPFERRNQVGQALYLGGGGGRAAEALQLFKRPSAQELLVGIELIVG